MVAVRAAVLVALLVKAAAALPELQQQLGPSEQQSGRGLLQLVGDGSDKCVSCDAAGRPFVEQPAAPAREALPPPGAPRAPISCDALRGINFSSSLPVVILDTGGQRITSLEEAQANITTCNAPDGADYSGPASVEIRGSSSARYSAKKSFTLRMRAPAGATDVANASVLPGNASDLDAEDRTGGRGVRFMGFPAGREFMLHGPENDLTQGLRNWVAYGLWRAMGRWTSRLQYCELFLVLDGSAALDVGRHYWGLYMAGEEIERGRARVPVRPLKPDLDLSGGYILRYEHGKNKNNASIVGPLPSTGMQWLLKYPGKSAALPSVVYEYLTSHLAQVEAAIWTGGGWRQLADEGSLVDYLLGTEVTKNPDGYRGSVYAHKDRQGPLVMGPMWDYNEAFGLCCGYPIEGYQRGGASNGLSGGSAISPQGWRFSICQEPARCVKDPIDGVAQWYMRLWNQDADFKHGAAQRWQQLRQGPLNNTWFSAHIEAATKAIYPDAVMRNYAKWRSVLRVPDDGYATDAAHFEGNVQRLSTWLALHLGWMDQQLQAVLQGPGGNSSSSSTSTAAASADTAAAGSAAAPVAAQAGAPAAGAGAGVALPGAGADATASNVAAHSSSPLPAASPLARIFGRAVQVLGL